MQLASLASPPSMKPSTAATGVSNAPSAAAAPAWPRTWPGSSPISGYDTRCSPQLTQDQERRDSPARRRYGLLAAFVCLTVESAMGKYVLAWILGVPATVLVVIYLIMHH